MKLQDTLSNSEQELDISKKVRIYLCGVTVYDESHIGHARTIIVFDVLRKYLGVPDNIISKKSSPHLWKEHEAEEELGITYEEIDSILYCLCDKKLSVDETIKITQIEKSIVDKVHKLNITSEHKRLPAQKPDRE